MGLGEWNIPPANSHYDNYQQLPAHTNQLIRFNLAGNFLLVSSKSVRLSRAPLLWICACSAQIWGPSQAQSASVEDRAIISLLFSHDLLIPTGDFPRRASVWISVACMSWPRPPSHSTPAIGHLRPRNARRARWRCSLLTRSRCSLVSPIQSTL